MSIKSHPPKLAFDEAACSPKPPYPRSRVDRILLQKLGDEEGELRSVNSKHDGNEPRLDLPTERREPSTQQTFHWPTLCEPPSLTVGDERAKAGEEFEQVETSRRDEFFDCDFGAGERFPALLVHFDYSLPCCAVGAQGGFEGHVPVLSGALEGHYVEVDVGHAAVAGDPGGESAVVLKVQNDLGLVLVEFDMSG
jgi:hypothetical protein